MEQLQVRRTQPIRRTRRGLLAGALAPVALSPLAACGLPGQSESAASGSKPAQSSGPVALDLAWEQTTNDMGQFVTGQAKQVFEERHPGVTLNIIDKGQAQEKVLAQAAAGTPPNVLWMGGNTVAFYANKDLLAPLDPLIQKDKEVNVPDFVKGMWDIFTYKGKQYGLPREGGPLVLYYNKSTVAGSGVQPPNDNWTLANEYRDAAVKLAKPGDPGVFGTDLNNWRNWVYSNGGNITDATATKYTLDQPAAVEALQLYQDFRYKFKCATTPQDNTAQGAMQRFIAGGLALFPGLRSAGNTSGFVQPTVGISQYPKGKAGRVFNQAGNGLAVLQPNKALDASWEAIKWYTSAEYQKLHYKLGVGGVVARQSVLQSQEYLTSVIPREWNEAFAKGVAFLKGPTKLPNWPDIDSTLDRELTAFQNGQETPAAVTARIAPIISSMLKEGNAG